MNRFRRTIIPVVVSVSVFMSIALIGCATTEQTDAAISETVEVTLPNVPQGESISLQRSSLDDYLSGTTIPERANLTVAAGIMMELPTDWRFVSGFSGNRTSVRARSVPAIRFTDAGGSISGYVEYAPLIDGVSPDELVAYYAGLLAPRWESVRVHRVDDYDGYVLVSRNSDTEEVLTTTILSLGSDDPTFLVVSIQAPPGSDPLPLAQRAAHVRIVDGAYSFRQTPDGLVFAGNLIERGTRWRWIGDFPGGIVLATDEDDPLLAIISLAGSDPGVDSFATSTIPGASKQGEEELSLVIDGREQQTTASVWRSNRLSAAGVFQIEAALETWNVAIVWRAIGGPEPGPTLRGVKVQRLLENAVLFRYPADR